MCRRCQYFSPRFRLRGRGTSLRRLSRRPQHHRCRFLVGHAFRIADDLHLQAPGREEIDDALAGGRALVHREWTKEGLYALAVEIVLRYFDVVDIEGVVIAADVTVLRRNGFLFGRTVLKQLDVGAVAQRTRVIWWITARGSTLSRSAMKLPFSSANGPNDIASLQPSTLMKKSAACLMSGTVMPVWSWPRRPGTPSARAAIVPASKAALPAAMAKQRAYRNTDWEGRSHRVARNPRRDCCSGMTFRARQPVAESCACQPIAAASTEAPRVSHPGSTAGSGMASMSMRV